MDLIGKKVKHNKFWEDIITQQDASYVSVKFVTEADPQKTMYPSFLLQNFLKAIGCRCGYFDRHCC